MRRELGVFGPTPRRISKRHPVDLAAPDHAGAGGQPLCRPDVDAPSLPCGAGVIALREVDGMARVLAELPTIAASATKLDHPGDSLPARRGQPFSVLRHICRPDHARLSQPRAARGPAGGRTPRASACGCIGHKVARRPEGAALNKYGNSNHVRGGRSFGRARRRMVRTRETLRAPATWQRESPYLNYSLSCSSSSVDFFMV